MACSATKLESGPVGVGFALRLVLPLLAALLPQLGVAQAAMNLGDVPFWQHAAGWWLGTNSYFDGDMNPRLREYHTLTGIEVRGDRVIETEYKFYPPGEASPYLSYGQILASQGVELVTISEHVAIADTASVRQESIRPEIVESGGMETRVVAEDSAIRRVLDSQTGYEHYRQYVSLNPPDRRYILNMGMVSDPNDTGAGLGGLRGFAISRGIRISADDVEGQRERLRRVHAVGGIVSAGNDEKRDVSLIDNSSQ
ncbi:hypothetical protein [Haliea sp. E17]|uniref:hypothetical protein n=1 Tax=Haliea sp. E17 TaxID=3401576 RepID=UPI003AB03CE4